MAPTATLVERSAAGDAAKTRWLIAALLRRSSDLRYVAVDISRPALEESAKALVRDYPGLRATASTPSTESGLAWLERARLQPMLLFWLGSNIGNFESRRRGPVPPRRERAAWDPRTEC